MICSVCKKEIPGTVTFIELHAVKYQLCDWDALRVKDLIEGTLHNHMINVFWGFGHLNWTCWETIRGILRENKIGEILEFGTGLSTELFVNEGLPVVSFDVCRPHVELYQKLRSLDGKAVLHQYQDGAQGPPVEELYPGRRWEFVFVDGPQERSREVAVAMKVASKFIYLHDPNMGEESFFPDENWIGIGTEPRFFVRKEFYEKR